MYRELAGKTIGSPADETKGYRPYCLVIEHDGTTFHLDVWALCEDHAELRLDGVAGPRWFYRVRDVSPLRA